MVFETNGALVMLSMPPAIIASAPSAAIAWPASATDFSPEPQTLLTVNEGMFSGKPARIADCLAGFWPSPACMTFPMMTSFTASGFMPVRLMRSLITIVPSSGASIAASEPLKRPTAVRKPAVMYASIGCPSALQPHAAVEFHYPAVEEDVVHDEVHGPGYLFRLAEPADRYALHDLLQDVRTHAGNHVRVDVAWRHGRDPDAVPRELLGPRDGHRVH